MLATQKMSEGFLAAVASGCQSIWWDMPSLAFLPQVSLSIHGFRNVLHRQIEWHRSQVLHSRIDLSGLGKTLKKRNGNFFDYQNCQRNKKIFEQINVLANAFMAALAFRLLVIRPAQPARRFYSEKTSLINLWMTSLLLANPHCNRASSIASSVSCERHSCTETIMSSDMVSSDFILFGRIEMNQVLAVGLDLQQEYACCS